MPSHSRNMRVPMSNPCGEILLGQSERCNLRGPGGEPPDAIRDAIWEWFRSELPQSIRNWLKVTFLGDATIRLSLNSLMGDRQRGRKNREASVDLWDTFLSVDLPDGQTRKIEYSDPDMFLKLEQLINFLPQVLECL